LFDPAVEIRASVRFRPISPIWQNGFVGSPVRFVAGPGTQQLHGIESRE
jgi:hypothetical protein